VPLDVLSPRSDPAVTLADLPRATVEAIYVHVPFCFHKCHYCDFYSITRQTPERMNAFVDRLLRELDQWLATSRLSLRPRTLFFGGGTPSLLPIDVMDRLLASLRRRLDLSAADEWTIEVNPATADLDYCRMLRSHGVDRLSFGAQSFDLAELATLERHHDPADVDRSVALARDAGFARVNLDLIYAIPGQSLASWDASLARALSLRTEHLSCYGLTYEPNTPIAVRQRLGHLVAAEETLELAMMRHARARLADAGLLPYEISNFARPGEACRHNLVYWTGGNYVGIGPSAASHVEGFRFRNKPHLGEWESAIDAARLPVTDAERLTATQRRGERVMLRLRLEAGVRFDDLDVGDGCDARSFYAGTIDSLVRLGLLHADDRGFRLSNAGLAVADAVAQQFVDASSA
jgi:oxygen-independent coproporphyrinogen-3 oxidase